MAKTGVTTFLRNTTRDSKVALSMGFKKSRSKEQAEALKAVKLHGQIDTLMVTAEVRICIDNKTLFGQFGVPFQGRGSLLDDAAFQLVFANVWRSLVESLAKTRHKVTCEASRHMGTTATMLGHATEFSQALVRTTCNGLMTVIKEAVETACNVEYMVHGPQSQVGVWEVDGNDVEQGVPELDGRAVWTAVEVEGSSQSSHIESLGYNTGATQATEAAEDDEVATEAAVTEAGEQRSRRAPQAPRAQPSDLEKAGSQQRDPLTPPPSSPLLPISDPEKAELRQRHIPHPSPTPMAQTTRPQRPQVSIDRSVFIGESALLTLGSGMVVFKAVAVGQGITLAAAAANPVVLGACVGTMVVVGTWRFALYCQG